MAVVPHRIEFENYHSVLGVFKLIGLVLTRMSKLRTATDGGGSKQIRKNAVHHIKLLIVGNR
ncbi:hypothetical protein C5O78_06305 [Treponema phagedenis]|nr:hypothetical protein C5O78_06305 [Treponema phagedenis]